VALGIRARRPSPVHWTGRRRQRWVDRNDIPAARVSGIVAAEQAEGSRDAKRPDPTTESPLRRRSRNEDRVPHTHGTAGRTGFLAEVVDNGVTPRGGTPTDVLTYYRELPAPPTTCPAPAGGSGSPLLFGDVTVIDAAPRPTSADEMPPRRVDPVRVPKPGPVHRLRPPRASPAGGLTTARARRAGVAATPAEFTPAAAAGRARRCRRACCGCGGSGRARAAPVLQSGRQDLNLRPPGPQPVYTGRKMRPPPSPPSPPSPLDDSWDALDAAVGTKAVPRRPTSTIGRLAQWGRDGAAWMGSCPRLDPGGAAWVG
jgi:hypothetical protein